MGSEATRLSDEMRCFAAVQRGFFRVLPLASDAVPAKNAGRRPGLGRLRLIRSAKPSYTMRPSRIASPSSSGPGRRPLTAETGVRVP